MQPQPRKHPPEPVRQRRRRAGLALAAVAALSLPLLTGSAAHAEAHQDNPYAGASAYVNSDYADLVDTSIAQTTDPTLRAKMQTVKSYPTAVWLDRIAAITGGAANAGRRGLAGHLDAALAQKRPGTPITATIVVYDLPGRDCAALASNGELPLTPAGLARYKAEYIDAIADIADDPRYADVRIVAIVEPDGLPNLVTNQGDPECAQAKQTGIYEQAVVYALNKLHAIPNVYTYLDMAHSGWLGWDDNLTRTVQLYTSVAGATAVGKSSVDGIVTNVANTTPTAEPFLTDPTQMIGGQPVRSGRFYEWNPNFDEADYTAALHTAFTAAFGWPASLGMLVDTSRNGWGSPGRPTGPSTSPNLDTYVSESKVDRRAHRGLWCNATGAGLGAPPQASPAGFATSHLDGFVWVKPPGESDGASRDIPNDEGKRADPMCNPDFTPPNMGGNRTGAMPDAPLAGHWFHNQFVMLVQNANPPVPTGPPPPDDQPPTVPSGLTVTATTANSATLSWTASSDNVGVAGYDVYRGDLKAGTAPGTSFTDTGLSPATQYTYTVKARDAAGNVSGASAPATATTQPGGGGGDPSRDWLHVQGNKVVDAAGNEVWLTGTNWFGFNTSERVFHGLWTANITQLTKAMADRGMNLVRVPISTQLLLEWKNGQASVPSGVNTNANPELVGKTTLQVFDYWLGLCERYGIKVMLDVHSAEADNSGHLYPVWWKGSVTTELFYQAWEWVTDRYKDNDTVVAMDIKNEPHGKQTESPRAKWDNSTDQDNFKNACQVAGNRILAINPNVLILCEGIEIFPKNGTNWSSTNTDDYHFNWWGGNLRGVQNFPVDLGVRQSQLMYSPHDYGPLVFEQPWFRGPFDKASLTADVWRPNWLYIHESGTAPLLVGEWGGRLGQDPRQDRWMFALRDLIVEHRLHQTFWVLNPNSGDTGGLLLDDWRTWDETKYAMLKPALWQHDGKFVSLDHQVKLGGPDSTTGISLGDRYGGGGGPPDTTPPTVPSGLTVTGTTATSVSLSWTAATDNVGVTGYDVYRDGTRVGSATGTTFTNTGLSPETRYTYTVRALDAAGNASGASAPVTATTQPGGGGGNGAAKVQYKNNSPATNDQEIKPGLQVVNPGTAPLNLTTVSVRYYFTRDGATYNIWCDWAQIGCGNLTARVVPLAAPIANADAYFEVTFTGGTLPAGGNTGDIQLRVSRTDWAPLDETNDYSRGAGTTYADAPKITAYVSGTLAWGEVPT